MKFKKIFTVLLLFSAFNCFAMSERTVDAPGVVGTLYYMPERLEQPVVAIWGGSDGGDFVRKNPMVMASVRALVKYGYAVLSITYFDPTGRSKYLPRALERIPLEYFALSFDWLQKQPELKKNTLAIYGTSRGAELALLLASKYDLVDLVIAGVPSSYVWGSYNMFWVRDDWSEMIQTDPCQAAWTWQGKDVANICHKYTIDYQPWYKIIENTEQVKDYIIPVEQSKAAIMLISGMYDDVWPSKKMSEQMISKLSSEKYIYPFEHVFYNTGHFVYSKSWPDVFDFIKLHYPVN